MATLYVLVYLGLTNFIKSINSLQSASYVHGTMLHAIENIKINYMIQQLSWWGEGKIHIYSHRIPNMINPKKDDATSTDYNFWKDQARRGIRARF